MEKVASFLFWFMIVLVLFGMFASADMNKNAPCEDFKYVTVKNIPSRCIKYFNGR